MFMNLYKHPKHGTYSIRLPRSARHPNGKLVSLRRIVGRSVKNLSEAREIFRVLQKDDLETRLEKLSNISRVRITGLSKEYTADPDRVTLSPSTLRLDKLALRTLADCVTDKYVFAVNKRDFKKFKQVLMARNLSYFTINTYRRHILAAWAYARECGYIGKIPAFKPIKTGAHLPRILALHEIKKILKYARKNDFEMWRIIKFSLWTGCRRVDLLALQHQHITGNLARITGKGGRQDIIKLLPAALEAIGTPRDVGPVFKQWHKDTVSHRFKSISLEVGIEEVHFHNLRHSAATYMIESGMHPKAVQAAMRHADFRTTEKYINLRNKFVFDEMDKFKIE